jgi:hypothetical protein
MQFTTFVVTVLMAGIATAAPAPIVAENAAVLAERQLVCTTCTNGSQACCDLTACFIVNC